MPTLFLPKQPIPRLKDKAGGIRVAGVHIGNYNGGWDKFFKNSIKALKVFGRFLLITDGNTSILDSLKKGVARSPIDNATNYFERDNS